MFKNAVHKIGLFVNYALFAIREDSITVWYRQCCGVCQYFNVTPAP